MSYFQRVVKKYNGVSLIIRILAGLVIGWPRELQSWTAGSEW